MSTSRYSVDADLKALAERQLAALFARGIDDEPKLVTTVQVEALQNLQLRATVEGHSFVSDEPMPKGGHDAGPAPLRYFLGGLVMCHQVWFIKAAVRRGLEIEKLSGEISAFSGSMVPVDSGHPGRPLNRFDYRINVVSPNTPGELLDATDEAVRFCPAMATVLLSTPMRLSLTVNGDGLHERTYGTR